MIHRLPVLVITIVLLASSGCKEYMITGTESQSLQVDNSIETDQESEEIISTYRSGIDSIMKRIINSASTTLTTNSPEGTLGNFCSDIVYDRGMIWIEEADIEDKTVLDFTLLNNGGLRAPIDSGQITVGDIYELMPFENEMVFIRLSGAKMTQLIEYVTEKSLLKGRKGGVPVSRQFELVLDTLTQKHKCIINGRAFDSRKSYLVATSDYLANGGDDMSFFEEPLHRTNTGVKLRDVFIEMIEELEKAGIPVDAEIEGRIRYAP